MSLQNWLPELNWSNTLSIIGLTAPFIFAGYKRHGQLRQLRNNYFPNVLHIQLFTIVPSLNHSNNNKYCVHYSSLLKDELKNVIYNYYGQRILRKYWRKCTKQDPLIRIQPTIHHHIILNSIITKIHERSGNLWIYRDKALSMDRNIINYDAINAEFYVLALVNTNVFEVPGDDISQFKLIRAILIKNKTLKYFDDNYDVANMSNVEWNRMLDTDYAKLYGDENLVGHCLRGWNTIKSILTEYNKQEKTFDGQLKWGEPMALLELPSEREASDGKKVYTRSAHSSWKTYDIPVELGDVDVTDEKFKENYL